MTDSTKNNSKQVLLGYHDKNINRIGIIDSDQLPILVEETFNPFLVTRDHNFIISTADILHTIKNFRALETFKSIKRKFANILMIPGLIVSVAYILKLLGIFQEIEFLELIISNKLANITFWTAVLGILILWHDYYRDRTKVIRLPEAPSIDSKDIALISSRGFNFARYIELKAMHFISEDILSLLSSSISGNIFYSIKLFDQLCQGDNIQNMFSRANLAIPNIEDTHSNVNISTIPDYPISSLRSLILYALEEALLTESRELLPEHFILAYFRVFPVLKKYLQQEKSTIELLREVARYLYVEENRAKNVNLFNIDTPYYPTGGIAKYWTYGYTFVLSHFSKDITEEIGYSQEKYGIGHNKEVEEIVSIIGRLSKKNVLLIGEPGVGKSSLIKGLAQRINRGNVPPQLANKRIVQLDLNSLLASGTKSDNLEKILVQAMEELANAGNTILYIDEIQELIPAKAQETGHNIASIMLPYILDGKFPIIGTINYSDYKKYFYSNESMRQSFENVEISQLSPRDTLRILETKIDQLEKNFNLYVTFPALTAAIELAQRYISNRKLPDSAVNTIEASCSWAQSQKIKLITNEHVAKYISIQTNIPVESITAEEATKLMNLEQNIKNRVIGQDDAVHLIVEALKRARTDVRDRNRPIGVFLFIGPTGTGKTHLAKVLSEEYFGDKSNLIQVDMSEYQEVSSIDKFLGTQGNQDALAQNTVTLLDRIKSKPYSVVLFDEVEKAAPQILDLFLQLFEEGHLTSNNGEVVDFSNTIIICTSNIGSRILLESLEKEKSLWEEAKNRALIEVNQALRPELINRFDSLVVFTPHSTQNLIKITELLLNDLAHRLNEKSIQLKWNKSIPMIIADRANEPGMGARPIRRFIQEKIEGRIATEIISGSMENNANIEIRESWLI